MPPISAASARFVSPASSGAQASVKLQSEDKCVRRPAAVRRFRRILRREVQRSGFPCGRHSIQTVGGYAPSSIQSPSSPIAGETKLALTAELRYEGVERAAAEGELERAPNRQVTRGG